MTGVDKIQPHAGRDDRFFYGYVLVAASFLLQAIGWGAYNSFGVFFNPLMNEYDWSRAGISGAVSVSFCLYGFSSILLGRLNDRVGPRFIMAISGIFLGVGYLLMSRLTSLWQLYLLYSLLVGIGISGTDVVLLSTIARWFVRLRGRMSGVLKVGTGVGMLVMPLFTNWLITAFGWRTAFFVMGIVVLIPFIGLSQLLVRDPARRGLRPDGDGRVTAKIAQAAEKGFTLRQALKNLQLWLICTAYFLLLVCVFTVLLHIVPHAIDLGIPPNWATRVLATIGGLSIVGRIIMGFSSDRIGNKWALTICYSFLCVSLGWLLLANRLWMLFVFAIVYGFAHGGFFVVMSPLIAEFFGTASHGAIFGMMIFVSNIGGAIGPLLAGYVFDLTGSYRGMLWGLPLISTVGLGAALMLRSPARR
ncbi:MAG: MFS transporter [Desulfobacterales bacterium]